MGQYEIEFQVHTTGLMHPSPDAVVGVLNELDPDFSDELDDAQKQIASHLLRRLITLWQSPAVLV